MKRSISLLSVLAFVLAFSGSVYAQNDVVNTYANVIQDVSYATQTDLNFGDFETSFTSGSATIDPLNASNDSGVNGTRGATDGYSAGKVFISGASDQSVTVDLNASTIQLTPQSGGSSDYFTLNPITMSHTTGQNSSNSGGNNLPDGGQVDLDSSGDATVWIGGDLTPTDDDGGGMSAVQYANESDLTLTINYTF